MQWAKNEIGLDSTKNLSNFSISNLKMALKIASTFYYDFMQRPFVKTIPCIFSDTFTLSLDYPRSWAFWFQFSIFVLRLLESILDQTSRGGKIRSLPCSDTTLLLGPFEGKPIGLLPAAIFSSLSFRWPLLWWPGVGANTRRKGFS